jgi:hypothetical protein
MSGVAININGGALDVRLPNHAIKDLDADLDWGLLCRAS